MIGPNQHIEVVCFFAQRCGVLGYCLYEVELPRGVNNDVRSTG